jgi:UDP-3-O-[3-hydroxymyristoyl] glucosamine N-acyltransferase
VDAVELRRRIPGHCTYLSVLREAAAGSITYYVGDDTAHVAHLRECTVLTRRGFAPDLDGVTVIEVEDPQLAFHRLSGDFRRDYLDYAAMEDRAGARVHRDAVVPNSCTVGPGSVIGACRMSADVRIDANVVVYSDVEIGSGTTVEPGTVLGAAGMMWVWDEGKKVHLEQLGRVQVGAGCTIGSNITIVRGNANEETVVGDGTCMAHGTMIGHGCKIGEHSHFANNVSFGGGVVTGPRCFFGCGSTVSPGKTIGAGVVLGAGSVLTKDAPESGIYVGVPARRVSEVKETMAGIPRWTP